jgi:hypothetical protein
MPIGYQDFSRSLPIRQAPFDELRARGRAVPEALEGVEMTY